MTPSEKKEYARLLCQELYNLIDAHNSITVKLTSVWDSLEVTWWQRILFFVAKRIAGKGIQSDMKLAKTIEQTKSRLDMEGEDTVDKFIVDLKGCIADQKRNIHRTKTQLERLQKL